MDTTPLSHLSKGSFLIASPEIDDGIYARSVILLCEHNVNGSFGLIINKPLEVSLPEEVLNPHEIANPHFQIYAGGPVQPNQLMLLHSSEEVPDQTLQVCDGVYLGGNLQFLQDAMGDPDGPYLRLCFGYSGWGSGQLEGEYLNGSWFIYPASAHYLFEIPSEKIWQTLLRKMGGKYATLSMIPEDLSLN